MLVTPKPIAVPAWQLATFADIDTTADALAEYGWAPIVVRTDDGGYQVTFSANGRTSATAILGNWLVLDADGSLRAVSAATIAANYDVIEVSE